MKLDLFLPTTAKEVKQRNWEQLDVVLFTGDAYIDHPAFGAAVIGRTLEYHGFKVAIVPQPNWRDDLRDFKKMGKPRLFFGVTAGAMDSMVNHYTANKRLRSNDAYTPDGKPNFRPDYAANVYSQILKKLFPDVPLVLGGIEASMRRFTHFDYWSDSLFQSILYTGKADLLVYGMGEKTIVEIAKLLDKGVKISSLTNLWQTAFLQNKTANLPEINSWETFELFSHEACAKSKTKFAKNFKHIETESNSRYAKRLTQAVGDKLLVVNPPIPEISQKEIDFAYDLPYTRLPHPRYRGKGAIPAYEMIKFSVNTHRGCFGGCSFCTISAHQGKFVVSRSEKSILNEVNQVVEMPDFKGYISDLGGPSANMYRLQGADLEICKPCKRPSCIYPSVCFNLKTSHHDLLNLYKKADAHPSVKKAFIGSGVRYDLLFNKKGEMTEKAYFEQLVTRHVSGRLKVAPEHTADKVLKLMRKPSFALFHKLKQEFEKINRKKGLKQQLIPYFISSHPASTKIEMAELASEVKNLHFQLEQIQDFTPTPMTLATVIFYTGIHPYSLKPVFTAKRKHEKLNQRKYFFWYKSEYRKQIIDELKQAGREDLIQKLFHAPVKKQSFQKKKIRKKRHRKY